MGNAGNRRQVEAAARREKGRRKGELQQVQVLMSDPRLRAFVLRLFDLTGVDRAPKFSSNAMTLANDVGVQSVGFWLLGEIREACPELELTMRREAAAMAQRADDQEEVDDEHSDRPDQ